LEMVTGLGSSVMSAPPVDNRYPWTGVRRASVRALDCLDSGDLLAPMTWQDALVGRYPHLFRRHLPGSSNKANRLTVGEGWQGTVEILVQRLAHIVQVRPVAIVRIFQNCGSLRVDTWADDAVDPELLMQVDYAIALAEARSACEQCGREGILYRRDSMLLTRCPQHAVGDAIQVRRGMERVHLVRRLVGGRPGPIGAGRYDRVTDTFTDIGPSTLNLEDPS
jgi:hypothetical protein